MSIELIKSMLRYDPATGDLYWTDVQTKAFRGKKAGTLDAHGYINLSIKRKRYKAHRVAWLLTYGTWPNGEIDHIDGDKLNNRIENLREATSQLNKWNHWKPQSNNVIGLRGVCKIRNKFKAEIRVDRKRIHIGVFETPDLAHQAYLNAKAKYHAEAA